MTTPEPSQAANLNPLDTTFIRPERSTSPHSYNLQTSQVENRQEPFESTVVMTKGVSLPILKLSPKELKQLEGEDSHAESTTADKSLFKRTTDFLYPSNWALLMDSSLVIPAVTNFVMQVQTAMCWRCYVGRVLPAGVLVVAAVSASLIGRILPTPIKNTAKYLARLVAGKAPVESHNQSDSIEINKEQSDTKRD